MLLRKILDLSGMSVWRRSWLALCAEQVAHNNNLLKLQVDINDSFSFFLHINLEQFNYLLHKITPATNRMNTYVQDVINPDERLTLTLRYHATGK